MHSSDDTGIEDGSLDLLELHQAKEQGRLLQRFKELRQWQLQQQEQLMQHQQKQLQAWQEEQSKVQTLIATQRVAPVTFSKVLKPSGLGSQSPILTPPTKSSAPNGTQINQSGFNFSQAAGISMDSGLMSMQDTLKSQSSLPKPVMYVDPSKLINPNDEDRYTNSELFSNPGSHEDQLEILRDDARPAPDWMSDSSDNFIPAKLPPPRPTRGGVKNGVALDQLAGLENLLNTAPAGLLQQVLNLLPGKDRCKTPPLTSTNVIELSASPTLPAPGQQPRARKLQFQPTDNRASQQHLQEAPRPVLQKIFPNSNNVKGTQVSSHGQPHEELKLDPKFVPRAMYLNDNEVNGDHREQTDSNKENNESWEDEDSSDDDYDDQNITAKEVQVASPDERPIKGAGETKTFEQLLEEKLKQEGEKVRYSSEAGDGTNRKKTFLRKGEGISRFNSVPKKPVKKPGTGRKTFQKTQRVEAEIGKTKPGLNSGPPITEGEGLKKFSVGSRLKTMTGDKKVVTSGPKTVTFGPTQAGEKPGKLSLIHSVASKKLEEQKFQQKDGASVERTERDHGSESKQSLLSSVHRSPSLESRSAASDHDTTELDSLAEFELLEDAVDNMSFCSNSSIVRKLFNSNKQGQKEALSQLRSKSETKKMEEMEEETRATRRLLEVVEENNPTLQSQDDEDFANSNNNAFTNSNSAFTNSTSAYTNNNNAFTNSNSAFTNSNNSANANISNTGAGSQQSPDVTLTGSSDEENDDTSHIFTSGASSSNPATSGLREPQGLAAPLSPTKAMTRKIAPMSSKFSSANDTQAMLKVLSMQAGFLTATSKINQGSSLPFQSVSNMFTSDKIYQNTSSQAGSLGVTGTLQSSGLIHQGTGYFTMPNGTVLGTGTSTAQFNLLNQNGATEPQDSSYPLVSNEPHFTTNFRHAEPAQVNPTEKSYNGDRYKSGGNDEDSDDDYNHYEESSESEKEETDEEQPGDNPPGATAKAGVTQQMTVFDDEASWEDEDDDEEGTVLKSVPASTAVSTPPTSKLVSRLFPKLRPKPNADAETKSQALHQATVQPVQSTDGIQSSILREKIKNLEIEIEKFRSENAKLEKLSREREEGLAKLKQEIEHFQKEKEEELKRIEEYKAEEMKKLKRERKLFDTYQKKIRSMPDKKDREEIDTLRNQLQELQDELKRKESRWSSSTTRLKDKIAELEVENGELKEEIRILEKKRLEWMAAQSTLKPSQGLSNGKSGYSETLTSKPSRQTGSSQPRSSTPTKEIPRSKTPTLSGHKDHVNSGALKPVSATGSSAPMTGSKTNSNQRSHTPQSTQNGGLSSTSSKADLQTSIVPPPLKMKVAGEIMQTQTNTVPVMIENTFPNSTPVTSMPGHQSHSANSCDKSVALLALEKAVIDKGDNSFTETRHQDGKLEKTFKNGAKEIHFPNGTVKEISADGQTIVCKLANGDIRQIFPDHRVVYIFAEAQIMQTTFPDGLETFQFKNGQVEKRYPDGTVEIIFPSKDVKYIFPDGGQEVILTDGTVMQYNSKGEKTVEYPSGDREVHTAEYQRREFPDGIIKTVYADGRHETRFPNGRIRIRDKAGNIIMDQIVYR
ncbi:centromere protein J-like [Physella acuta]|uniref:centromere protein J-like n=1 Tax=Physella acuta TaxID=109671 RepID=UPI0027DB89FE|nr:centromere protein J-like [Physella acuta]